MQTTPFECIGMNQLAMAISPWEPDWLWAGYLARGEITLFTSGWKLGKTTLVSGLLRALGLGEPFLGRNCTPARVLVVSEESRAQWSERQVAIPIGDHVRLLSRPFLCRPTPQQWDDLVRYAEGMRTDSELAALVIDPLAAFLPGSTESDPGALLAMLHPLRRLATNGVAVLILHHPTKKAAEEGYQPRGNGILLGYVDIAVELNRLSPLTTDTCRRRLRAFSRHAGTPSSLVFEWTPGSPDFRVVDDLHTVRFRENWQIVAQILSSRDELLTHRQLLDDWPSDNPPPSASQLYQWLGRAVNEDLAARYGSGTRSDPYRFTLGAKGRLQAPSNRRRVVIFDGYGNEIMPNYDRVGDVGAPQDIPGT